MGKGKAVRRRAQNALKALHGNLHKAQFGKASASLPLPDAPTKDQLQDKMPASLRKVMALKALVQREASTKMHATPGAGTQPGLAEQSESGQGAARGKAGLGQGSKAAAGASKNQPAQHGADGPSISGKHAAADVAVRPSGRSVFEVAADEKKLKTRKKEYLKRKEEKKKAGRHGAVDPSDVQLRDYVKFGEVVSQPLEVQLKRRHWATKVRTASERCKDVFLKQMEEATRRMAPEAGGARAADATGQRLAGAALGGMRSSGAEGRPQKKAHQPNAKDAAEQEALRQQVIDAYRSQKKRPAQGGADLGTLAQLVKRKPASAAIE